MKICEASFPAGLIKLSNIFWSQDGFIIRHRNFLLFTSYWKWVTKYRYIFKNSKYLVGKGCIEIDVADEGSLPEMSSSYSYKYMFIYLFKFIGMSRKFSSSVERDDVNFGMLENPIIGDRYSYKICGITISSYEGRKCIKAPYDSFLTLVILCFEYELIYRIDNVRTVYIFRSDKNFLKIESSTEIYDIIFFYMENPCNFVEAEIIELDSLSIPHYILTHSESNIEDLEIKELP